MTENFNPASDGMLSVLLEPEDFFVGKIKLGLGEAGLSQEEEEYLRLPVTQLESSSYTQDQAKTLQDSCIAALTRRYQEEISVARERAVLWRNKNEQLYAESDQIISAVVQNWYLQEGRGQEKRAATGCASILVIAAVLAFVLA